ncbi:MAG: maleylacetoacetate isomerase [Sulfuritalea sp.]|jgi:maleylacetoacetate isomerase|nr:maleylacetoacetate isomerase [Sulfuritalea sp.]MDP1982746.1 maleylacetoacetate isomerase [Sulfuritalea sp.]
MKLYNYFRSSASFRVRIALALKQLDFEYVSVHLLQGGGQQFAAAFRAMNPAALVPVLEEDDGRVLTQSLAIIEYLDETRPQPPLLPPDAVGRARARALALAVACEIHPLNNLRVLAYLSKTLGVSEEQKSAWYRHWVETGLATVEAMLAGDRHTGRCCHGDTPTLADICLVPQIFNAQRFKARLDHVPTVMRIHEHCLTLPAFAQSVPALQPDAE